MWEWSSWSSNYNSSYNNYSWNNTYTNSNIDTNYSNTIKTTTSNTSNKCLFNWVEYTKPSNAHCVPEDKYNAWKCDSWYNEKNNYCWCTSWNYSCPTYLNTTTLDNQIDTLQREINNMYVNQYSDSSVNNYNSKVTKKW